MPCAPSATAKGTMVDRGARTRKRWQRMQPAREIFAVTVALSLAAVLAACPRGDERGGSGDSATPSTSSVASASASTSSSVPAHQVEVDAGGSDAGVVAMHAIDGLGEVPLWAPETNRSACYTTKEQGARIEELAKGGDATIGDGTADLGKLAADASGGCFVAVRALAKALDRGGQVVLGKKQLVAAERWFRAALLVRPSFASARYDLARALALDAKPNDAVWAIAELARAARANDASALALLEQAKTDDAFAKVRAEPTFAQALEATNNGVLIGPRKDPQIAAEGVKLLPLSFSIGANVGGSGPRHYKPAVVDVFTWHPAPSVELFVATLVHDPASIGKPKADVNSDYGGVAVFRRTDGKLTLLFSEKLGEAPPAIAAGKNGTILLGYQEQCGDLKGALKWKNDAVESLQTSCGSP